MKLPNSKTLNIDKIKPYERNPRKIPLEAVEAVKTSIENFGYIQPILVDSDHVVIAGHTRLQALKQLGHTEAEVYVTDMDEDAAKKYRIADNRLGELTDWDHEDLVAELREWESELLDDLFPDVDLEVGNVGSAVADITEEDVEEAEAAIQEINTPEEKKLVGLECPSCAETFEMDAMILPGN